MLSDPDVLSVLMENECDLEKLSPALETAFQDETKKKYKTVDALKKAWDRTDAPWKSFRDLPPDSISWMKDTNQRGADYFQFMTKVSKENLAWFTSVCRDFGYKGPVTSYDMTKDFYRSLAREDAGSVYMHVYQGHPMVNDISQESVLGNSNGFFRNMAATQYVDKPLFMTEANICFWNQYRYEQAFALNAYAALNGFDGILNFTGIFAGAGRRDGSEDYINPFFGSLDPVCYATEFLGMHLFRNNAV